MKELNPYHGVLSPEELKEQIDRQIDIESKDLIYVESVEKRSKLTDYDIKMVWLHTTINFQMFAGFISAIFLKFY